MTDNKDVDRKEVAQSEGLTMDDATREGLEELLDKISPLLQGRRLHNVVDALSWLSDMIDMADEAMINKLAANYEQAIGGMWALSNAARYAANDAARQDEVPSRLGLLRAAKDEDVRRGLYMLLRFAAVFGRQARPD